MTQRDVRSQGSGIPATMRAVTASEIEDLLIFSSADVTLFKHLRDQLRPQHLFKQQEYVARLAYIAMLASYEVYQGWTYQTLLNFVTQYLTESPEDSAIFNEAAGQSLLDPQAGLLAQIARADLPMCAINRQMANDCLRLLLKERLIVETLRKQVNPNNDLPNVDAMLETVNNQFARISATSLLAVRSVMDTPEDDLQSGFSSVQPVLTGYQLLDIPLGGQRAGDVNGLIGYTGGGKSTMALDMATQMCKYNYAFALSQGSRPRPVLYLSLEEPDDNLRERLYANFYSIPRHLVSNYRSASSFSDLLGVDYETDIPAGTPDYGRSERDRFYMWREAAKLMKTVDLSGSDANPNAGSGGVTELAAAVDACVQTFGVSPTAVFIDYAGLSVERSSSLSESTSGDAFRYALKRFGDDVMQLIAKKFETTVWVIQQLRGDAGSASPTHKMGLSDIEGCKTFANNMSTVLVMGVPDRNNLRLLNYAKTRHLSATQSASNMPLVPEKILQVHNLFARMVDVTSQFHIDRATRQFVSRDRRQNWVGRGSPPTNRPGQTSNQI